MNNPAGEARRSPVDPNLRVNTRRSAAWCGVSGMGEPAGATSHHAPRHRPPSWSSRRGCGVWPRWPDARGRGLAREWAAARRTDPGPRPHPRHPGPLKTGISLSVTRGGCSPFHRVGQVVFGGQPFEELLQGAVLVTGVGAAVPVQQPGHPPLDVLTVHLLPADPARLPGQAGGEPLDRLGVGPYRLGGLASAARRRANELILAWSTPASSCLGCRERGSCAVMGGGLFLWRTIRSPALPQARDFKASTGQRNDSRDVPAAETGRRSETRVPRWLNPGRRRTTDRVGGAVPACPPKCLPARGVALFCCRVR
jgi:hypothetical protein